MVAMSQREFRQIFPQPGWVEHDAEEIWQTQLATAREALAQAGIPAAAVAAIGITNQRETTVLWNRRTGQPLHHAIVWQDRRGEPLCAQLRADGLAPHIRQATGVVVDSYFSATKLRWLLDQVPGAREMAQRGELAFGTVDSWLLWKLTGGAAHATDVTNASRTMLFDIRHHAWDPLLLDALQVPDSVLPAVHPSSLRYGTTDPSLLGAAIPGMVGAIMALRSTYFVVGQVFDPMISVTVIAMAILGGGDAV
jgi:glycerol kinase